MSESKTTQIGYVALVGAGPGDPGLITLRGMHLITRCDVLVYDNLMADEFVALSSAPEKIFVGKSSGCHALPQEEICALLVKKAQEGKRVVRLKGGDPFVFGRGGEECQALALAGVPYEVVPGATAGIAGTAYAGVPVTHREVSRGLTVMTAHFAKDKQVDLPWEALARLDHTLVFYMGVASLETVSGELVKHGLSAEMPAMVLERATTGAQREIISDLASIAAKAREAGIRPPGLLVVGNVVNLAQELAWLPDRPLAGKRVLFTRAAESQYEAVHRLRLMGAEVLDLPVVSAEERREDPAIDRAIDELDQVDAIAFTSAIAVDLFFKRLNRIGMDVRRLAQHTLAAASPTVLEALRRQGVMADLTPEKTGAGQLAKMLQAGGLPTGSRVLLPRSSAADQSLPKAMIKAGYTPVPVDLYDSVSLDVNFLTVKLANWTPEAILFLSGSGVQALHRAAPGLFENPNGIIWACIGNKTSESLVKTGVNSVCVPEQPAVDAMVDLVVEQFQRSTAPRSIKK